MITQWKLIFQDIWPHEDRAVYVPVYVFTERFYLSDDTSWRQQLSYENDSARLSPILYQHIRITSKCSLRYKNWRWKNSLPQSELVKYQNQTPLTKERRVNFVARILQKVFILQTMVNLYNSQPKKIRRTWEFFYDTVAEILESHQRITI